MLRDFQINGAKAPDAMHKAKVDMMTGMAVVKEDGVNKYANVTASEAVADLYFVNKERVPYGIYTGMGDMSDYHEQFVNVKADEFVTLEKYHAGESFGIDQFDAAEFTAETAMDKRVSFKNGKAMIATVASPYVFKGMVNDAGHTLIKIEVSDVAVANA